MHHHTNPDIHIPIASYTMHYGLDHHGEPTITEAWTNHQHHTEEVPMLTRTGLLTMAQQTLTAEALGHFDTHDDDPDHTTDP